MIYRCYGLTISSEIPLPELLPATLNSGEQADVQVRIGDIGQDERWGCQQIGPYSWMNQQNFFLQLPKIAHFHVRQGREIIIAPVAGCDMDGIRLFLLGSMLGVIMYQRGCMVLHGNAIRVDDGCLICSGHSGSGKSSLAMGFLRRGYGILADDVVPVNDQMQALSGYPRIKLFKDIADHFGLDVSQLSPIRPQLAKYHYPVGSLFVEDPLPVRWIYILSIHNASETTIEPLVGVSRFSYLVDHAYRRRHIASMNLMGEYLSFCNKLCQGARVMLVKRPQSGLDIDGLVELLLQHRETLS